MAAQPSQAPPPGRVAVLSEFQLRQMRGALHKAIALIDQALSEAR